MNNIPNQLLFIFINFIFMMGCGREITEARDYKFAQGSISLKWLPPRPRCYLIRGVA